MCSCGSGSLCAPILLADPNGTQDNVRLSVLAPECSTGGVAAVHALVNSYQQQQQLSPKDDEPNRTATMSETTETANGLDDDREANEPFLVMPMGDFKAPLTALSQFAFGVNVLILRGALQWRTWTVPAYTTWPNRLPAETVYHAQDPDFCAVISNAVLSPTNPWHGLVQSLYVDEATRLAMLYLTKERVYNLDTQVAATQALLQHVAKLNAARQCSWNRRPSFGNNHSNNLDQEASSVWWEGSAWASGFASHPLSNNNNDNSNVTTTTTTTSSFSDWWTRIQTNQSLVTAPWEQTWLSSSSPSDDSKSKRKRIRADHCLTPVLVWDDASASNYQAFVQALQQQHSQSQQSQEPLEARFHHLPHLVVDL